MSTSDKDRVLAVLDHHTSHMATAATRKVRSVRPEGAAKIATDLREVRATVAEVYAQRDALAALLNRAVESEGPFGSDRRPEWFNDACAALARVQEGAK